MKKILLLSLVSILLVSGCGGEAEKVPVETSPDDQIEDTRNEVKSYFDYRFIMTENSSLWPVGVYVPEGYSVNDTAFNSSGTLAISKDESYARFQFSVVFFSGNTDAIVYFDRTIKNDTMASSKFSHEKFDGPIFTPFPGEEDLTHSEATYASAMYTREESEGTEVMGEIWVYWFDVKETETNKPASMGFVLMSESTTDNWAEVDYELDMIRKSIFLLPSKSEIENKMYRAELNTETYSKARFAREEIELKQLQMRKGIMPAPNWQTLHNKMVACYGDKDDSYYLVDFVDTPSGLLPHPTIPGMTVDPKLPDGLFKYLREQR